MFTLFRVSFCVGVGVRAWACVGVRAWAHTHVVYCKILFQNFSGVGQSTPGANTGQHTTTKIQILFIAKSPSKIFWGFLIFYSLLIINPLSCICILRVL